MNSKRMILAGAIVGKLILSILICSYFWESNDLDRIQQIPIQVLIFTILYIALQLLTRKLSIVHNWWDWVYYAGLLSIMIPTLLSNSENQQIFHAITDYGTFCLILPVLVDGWNFVTKASKKK